MTPRELHAHVAEYPSVLCRAGQEGWLAPLVEAHLRTCTERGARRLIDHMDDVPADLDLSFRKGRTRGRARYCNRKRQYGLSLPRTPGTHWGHLRVGLVLHEVAHVWAHQLHQTFDHGPEYCRELRSAVEQFQWRKILPMTSSFREIYDRHRGPYSLLLTRDVVKGKKTVQEGERLDGPFSAEDAHEEARVLVTSVKETVVDVHVYSNTEGQFIGAIYRRGETYKPWSQEETREGRLELSADQSTPNPDEATLLQPGRRAHGHEPLRQVDDLRDTCSAPEAVPQDRPVRNMPSEKPAKPRAKRERPTKLPGDRFPVVRGRALALNTEGGTWPPSAPAQAIREFFTTDRRATAAEVVAALGPKLQALGVAHPGSLVSRLKQAGVLKEVVE